MHSHRKLIALELGFSKPHKRTQSVCGDGCTTALSCCKVFGSLVRLDGSGQVAVLVQRDASVRH